MSQIPQHHQSSVSRSQQTPQAATDSHTSSSSTTTVSPRAKAGISPGPQDAVQQKQVGDRTRAILRSGSPPDDKRGEAPVRILRDLDKAIEAWDKASDDRQKQNALVRCLAPAALATLPPSHGPGYDERMAKLAHMFGSQTRATQDNLLRIMLADAGGKITHVDSSMAPLLPCRPRRSCRSSGMRPPRRPCNPS